MIETELQKMEEKAHERSKQPYCAELDKYLESGGVVCFDRRCIYVQDCEIAKASEIIAPCY